MILKSIFFLFFLKFCQETSPKEDNQPIEAKEESENSQQDVTNSQDSHKNQTPTSEQQPEPIPYDPPDLPQIPLVCPQFSLPTPTEAPFTVGTGTPESCTEQALRDALAHHTNIQFDCGPKEKVIFLESQIEIDNPFSVPPIHHTTFFIDGGNQVRLDGQKKTRILFMHYRTNLVLSNIVIQNGYTRGTNYAESSGSGVLGGMDASTYLLHVTFYKNRSLVPEAHLARKTAPGGTFYELGGAFHARGGINSFAYVKNSRFYENEGVVGGGIMSLLTDLTVIDSVFENNYAHDVGGGLYTDGARSDANPNGMSNGVIRICRSLFKQNESVVEAGGAYVFTYGNRELSPPQTDRCELLGVHFEKNKSKTAGALRVGTGPAEIKQASFFENQATNVAGALLVGEQSHTLIENTTFYKNHVEGGQGLRGVGGAILHASSGITTILNTSFLNNYADQHGGALYSDGGNSYLIYNNIFYSNSTGADWHNQCNKTWPGVAAILFPRFFNEFICVGGGVIESDPLIDAPQTVKGLKGFPLKSESPALGVGNMNQCLSEDQWGKARSKPCSLGAIE